MFLIVFDDMTSHPEQIDVAVIAVLAGAKPGSFREGVEKFDELGPGFASGHLKPFPIQPNAIYPLEQAKAAFVAVAGSSRDRVILRPAGSARLKIFPKTVAE